MLNLPNLRQHLTTLLGLLLAMSCSFAISATGSPVVGAQISDFRISDGELLPLPPGQWRVRSNNPWGFCEPAKRPNCGDGMGRVVVLENTQNDTPVYSIVIRYTNTRVRNWSLNWCYEPNRDYKDLHGTNNSDVVRKCSRGWDEGLSLSRSTDPSAWYWQGVIDDLPKVAERGAFKTHLEVNLQANNQRTYSIDIFLARDLQGDFLKQEDIMGWKKRFVDTAVDGLFNGQVPATRGILALGKTSETNLTQSGSITGAYDVGGGASIPLPAGPWAVLQAGKSTEYGSSGQLVVLGRPQGVDDAVVGIVAHYTSSTERWRNDAWCYKSDNRASLKNFYGTKSSDMLNKCSFAWGPTSLHSFIRRQEQRNVKYWMEVKDGIFKLPDERVIGVEIELRKFNGRNINLMLAIKPPTSFRGQPVSWYSNDIETPVTEWLQEWVALYTESLHAAFQLEKSVPGILALGFDGPVKDTQLAKVRSGQDASLADLVADATDGDSNKEDLSQAKPMTLVADVARDEQPVRVTANPQPVAAPPVEQSTVALEVDTALAKIEEERMALAKQKESMASELASMRAMLAELKKANEEAAKAEQVAAAPTAVETPAKPVVMARRRALVVGNETYKNVPVLENAAEDARAMAVALTGLGYEVDTHIDLTERGFKRALRDFRADLNGGEEVLFFFAGHGVQLGNSNFLLPTDLGSDSAEQVKDESIELQKVLNDLADQKTKFALAVIDACRDNPFKQNGRAIGGRGLAPTTAATGQMVMFSAGAGQQALDKLSDQDKGKNGLFTRVFLEEMKRPGVSVDRVLRNVRQRVVDLARSVGHEQVPALYDQAVGEFYFKPK